MSLKKNKTLFLSQISGKKSVMRYLLIIAVLFNISFTAQPQQSRMEYIQRYQLLAIEEMGRSGIPASIKMAQACLESGNGNSELSRRSNNHFGIKCKSTWRGQKIYYDDDYKNECFRKYKSVEDSYIDHSNFLMSNPRYAFLFTLPPDDYKSWARGLKEAGYATARDYDKRLIKIIEENELFRLDHKGTFDQLYTYEQKNIGNPGISNRVTIDPFKSHEKISVNGLDAVIARRGDTYEIIAQLFGLKPWELYRFNDLPEGYRPKPNEVIYIESKKQRGSRNHLTHRVEEGETMHYISQLYGIKLNPLIRRNRMEPGQEPGTGEILYLRRKKTAH